MGYRAIHPTVTVYICDDTSRRCAESSCRNPADLVVRLRKWQDTPWTRVVARRDRFWCVDHWRVLRLRVVICYGKGAPERIVERLGIGTHVSNGRDQLAVVRQEFHDGHDRKETSQPSQKSARSRT